jgi:hypothetical protein
MEGPRKQQSRLPKPMVLKVYAPTLGYRLQPLHPLFNLRNDLEGFKLNFYIPLVKTVKRFAGMIWRTEMEVLPLTLRRKQMQRRNRNLVRRR